MDNRILGAAALKHIEIKTKYFRMFFSKGQPKMFLLPRINKMAYDKHWGLKGFCITWLGEQVFFSFGKDKNGLYSYRENEL